jgi:hypothetical protein
MRHTLRLLAVALVVAAIGATTASAAGNDWGTWTFEGHGTEWSGTLVDAHRVQGIVIGTKSLPKYNGVTSLTIGGKKCKISSGAGTGYCYGYHVPANKKLNWTLTTRKPLKSSDQLVPCIEWNTKYHCRYGNG